MQRSHVRRLLIGAVMLSLGGLGFVLGRTMISQQQASVQSTPASDLEPDVSQRIREFRRVKVKDGRKEWELTAQEAEVFTEQNQVAITGPKLAFYGGDGRNVEVKGHEGRVFLADGNVERIELSGGIDVTVGEYFVQTDKAIYFENINAIAAPGEVKLKGADIQLAGQAMLLELGAQKVMFRKGVTTTFRGASDDETSGGDVDPGTRTASAPAQVLAR